MAAAGNPAVVPETNVLRHRLAIYGMQPGDKPAEPDRLRDFS
ncbi:hypothetical protein [Methylococcus sp. Mc7]|nr:hypothetical protein [Methylococcus sp. Mc7]